MLLLVAVWFANVQSAPVESLIDDETSTSMSAFCQQLTISFFQAILAATISVIFILCCYALKSRFTSPNYCPPGKRGYSVKNYFRETMESHFDRRQNLTKIDPMPLWQVPPLKSHRTNR